MTRQGKTPRCECSRRATVKKDGRMICRRCFLMGKPQQTHKIIIGVRYSKGDGGAAHIDWERYHQAGPICVPVEALVEMLNRNLLKAA